MSTQSDLETTPEEILFEEWRELFTKYRNKQALSPLQRRRFRVLSAELRRRGFFKNELGLHTVEEQ